MADQETVTAPEATPPEPAPTPAAQAPELTVEQMRAAAVEADQRQEALEQGEIFAPAPTIPEPQIQVPEKFKNPDGTVDEEKIKDSTRQLDEAIAKKELSIEEALAQYAEKEKKFRNLPNPEKLAQRIESAPDRTLGILTTPAQNPQEEEIRKQILADMQADPVGTVIRLSEIVADQKTAKRVEPLQRFVDSAAEREKAANLRSSLKEAATQDPRILQPNLYQETLKELDSDPGLWNLKNPHEVAWLKVKARLRLGEFNAQPSRPTTVTLGGGSPPPVPSASSGMTQRDLLLAMNSAKPDQVKAIDALIRKQLEAQDASVR